MAARADALDDFLAQVTAFGETHGVVQSHFKQQVVFGKIHTVAGDTGFYAQNILRLFTDPRGA